MKCVDIIHKIKSNIPLTDKEKKHILTCNRCSEEYEKRFETKLQIASNVLKKKTEKKINDDFTRNIMLEIGIGVREKIKVINYRYILITLLSFFITLTIYFVVNNRDNFMAFYKGEKNEDAVYKIKRYIKEDKGTKIINTTTKEEGFLLTTDNNMFIDLTSLEFGPVEIFSNTSFHKKDKDVVNLEKGTVFFNVSQVRPFTINMEKVIFYTNSASFLVEKKSNITLFMFEGKGNIIVEDKDIDLIEGNKIIINQGYSNYNIISLSALDYKKLEDLRDEKN